jgi:hypothetical protein
MSAIDKIAYSLNRRDEVPNQELARELAEDDDREGIREIAENLHNKNQNIQSDCLKVLYEIGYLKPGLIAEYVDEFLKLLKHKNNRMVWGGLIALSSLVKLEADLLYLHAAEFVHFMQTGSVICVENAFKILAGLCAATGTYEQVLFHHLVEHLQSCRPIDLARRAEYTLVALTPENRAGLGTVLQQRLPDLTPAQAARMRKVLRTIAEGSDA